MSYTFFIKIFIIAIGLSMDAATVSITNSMVYKETKKQKLIAMAFTFGIFQMIMPIAGYYIGSLFIVYIKSYSKYIVMFVLGFLGINMIIQTIRNLINPESIKIEKTLSNKMILLQAIATSIDALAIGVCLNAESINTLTMIESVAIIGLTTSIISVCCIFIGKKFGNILGMKAGIIGGILLILISINALFEII